MTASHLDASDPGLHATGGGPPVRVGIVGAGKVAALHLAALKQLAGPSVIAVADVDPEAARRLAGPFAAMAVQSLDELLATGVDVVHNCTSNHAHAEVNACVLAARKHLLAEKPLAISSDESASLVEMERAAAADGVVAAVCFTRRHLPAVRHMRGKVESGVHGPVHLVRAAYAQDWLLDAGDWNWRLDPTLAGPSATVADIGSHTFDLVEHLTGSRIIEVVADLRTLHRTRGVPPAQRPVSSEDHAAVLGVLESGVQVTVELSQVSAGHRDRMAVELSLGNVTLAWDYEDPTWLRVGRRPGGFTREPLSEHDGQAFTHCVRDFYEAISRRSCEGLPLASFADGHHSVRLVEAVLESSRRRQWVEVVT